MQCNKMSVFCYTRAAAKRPAAPPIKIIAPVGRGPAGAWPVLCDPPLADPEGDPEGVTGTEDPVADTTATVRIASISLSSLRWKTVELTPGVPRPVPLLVAVQVMSAEVNSPVQLQLLSTVQAPGTGSVRWNSHVDGPWMRVYGSQKDSSSSSSCRRRRAFGVGAGVGSPVIGERFRVEASRAILEASLSPPRDVSKGALDISVVRQRYEKEALRIST